MVCSRLFFRSKSDSPKETANELENDDAFEHISVLQEISQYVNSKSGCFLLTGKRILLPDLKLLHQEIKLSNTTRGDGMIAFYWSEDV